MNSITEITPEKFEQVVASFLNDLGKPLANFQVSHNEKIEGPDGIYQIDVKATFQAFDCDFLVLVECKRYKESIKREKVQVLYDKIRALGAHKGIIFSTAPFQTGALLYAQAHGIALIQVIEGRYTYMTRSDEEQRYNPPPWADIPEYVGVFRHNFVEDGNSYMITNLQKNHMEDLSTFLFGNNEAG